MSTIHDLDLGQPVGEATAQPGAQTVQPVTKTVQPVTQNVQTATEPSEPAASSVETTTLESSNTVKEMPTTNPAVHVVLTNSTSPRPRAQTDTMALHPDHPVSRARADTTASSISTISSTTGTSDADEDEDDYDPAQGGDEKTCIKEKRVKDWSKRFHPGAGEELLCTHGCALVIEIMIHGRMYLSNKRICFRSNILGVRTKREILIKHIHAIVLKNVAGMIPNSFEVHANDKKYQFTTLPDRDHVLRILIRYWAQENPQVYAAFMEKHPEFSVYTDASSAAAGSARRDSVVPGRRDSVAGAPAAAAPAVEGAKPEEQTDAKKDPGNGGGPRAATKADTNDLEKVALDTILPSEPEKIYKLLYHNDEFLQSIWKEEGFKDIQMNPWTNKRREFQYARPVGSIGSTTCKSSEEIVHPEGQDEWYCVEGRTQTPGVPSGKSFATRSKTVFTWAEGGGTKMHVTFQVDWTGKSMLKGTINSQSVSGQKHWNGLLAKKIRAYIRAHPDEFPASGNAASAAAAEEEGADDEDVATVGGTGGDEARTMDDGNGPQGARDPMASLARQQEILVNEGPIAYLADDPIRGALLVLFALFVITSFFGLLKRLLWTGAVVTVPRKRWDALQAAEEELARLVGDVRQHLKAGRGVIGGAVKNGARETVKVGKGVVGGAGPVVKRTAIAEL